MAQSTEKKQGKPFPIQYKINAANIDQVTNFHAAAAESHNEMISHYHLILQEDGAAAKNKQKQCQGCEPVHSAPSDGMYVQQKLEAEYND